MFPFDLAGPQFLGFYLVAGVALLGLAVFAIQELEGAAAGKGALLTDPYEIAYLRGGAAEAIRIAVLSLIDRDLLRQTKDEPSGVAMLEPGANSGTAPRHPLERAVMAQVDGPTRADGLTKGSLAQSASALIAPALAARSLIVDGPIKDRRRALIGGVWAFLTLIFVARMAQAIANQRSNVGLLCVAWIVASIATLLIVGKLPHAGGARALESLRALLGDLRQRIGQLQPGGATSELILLASVFGFAAVPATLAPYAADLSIALSPPPPRRSSDGCGSGGGGCGSGGGGGCGGGGGGCGGCGGG
jgi:uncharacterized protein (TIGR04222 family)